jgi:hypothetical protein
MVGEGKGSVCDTPLDTDFTSIIQYIKSFKYTGGNLLGIHEDICVLSSFPALLVIACVSPDKATVCSPLLVGVKRQSQDYGATQPLCEQS